MTSDLWTDHGQGLHTIEFDAPGDRVVRIMVNGAKAYWLGWSAHVYVNGFRRFTRDGIEGVGVTRELCQANAKTLAKAIAIDAARKLIGDVAGPSSETATVPVVPETLPAPADVPASGGTAIPARDAPYVPRECAKRGAPMTQVDSADRFGADATLGAWSEPATTDD